MVKATTAMAGPGGGGSTSRCIRRPAETRHGQRPPTTRPTGGLWCGSPRAQAIARFGNPRRSCREMGAVSRVLMAQRTMLHGRTDLPPQGKRELDGWSSAGQQGRSRRGARIAAARGGLLPSSFPWIDRLLRCVVIASLALASVPIALALGRLAFGQIIVVAFLAGSPSSTPSADIT